MEYNLVVNDPGLLYFGADNATNSIRLFIVESTPDESWESTASKMTKNGVPCECVYQDGWTVGFLFKDPKQKLEFILKCK